MWCHSWRVSCCLSGGDFLWCLQEAHRQRRRVWIPRIPAVNADNKINLFTVIVGGCACFTLLCRVFCLSNGSCGHKILFRERFLFSVSVHRNSLDSRSHCGRSCRFSPSCSSCFGVSSGATFRPKCVCSIRDKACKNCWNWILNTQNIICNQEEKH